MTILNIALGMFAFIELLNILMLYFQPGSKKGNGVGVFNAWEKSKQDEELHTLVKYLTYWVAGSKIIFVGLLIVIIVTGSFITKLAAAGVMILSIATFYWKLFPIIRGMDRKSQISPAGYSKVLGWMIGVFILGFSVVFVLALVTGSWTSS